MQTFYTQRLVGALLALLGVTAASCGGEENPYKPQPEGSGKAPNLTAPPTIPSTPIKQGDGAYTVYGAIHQLRRLLDSKDATAQPISIAGVAVVSDIPPSPAVALLKARK